MWDVIFQGRAPKVRGHLENLVIGLMPVLGLHFTKVNGGTLNPQESRQKREAIKEADTWASALTRPGVESRFVPLMMTVP